MEAMDIVVHIGAGSGRELPDWLASGARRVVLVEPNPVAAERLRRLAAEHAQVTVVEAAIATEGDRNQLLEFNLPQASSLRSPTELQQLFPGLRLYARHTVDCLSPAAFMERFGPEADETAALVVEAPGEEYGLFEAWVASDELQRFSAIRFTANPSAGYEGAVPAQRTLQMLQAYGYDVQHHDENDPDWPTWWLRPNPLKRELQALEQAFEAARSEVDRLETEKGQLARRCREAEQQLGEQAEANKKLKAELEQTKTWFKSRKEQAEKGAEQIKELQGQQQKLKGQLEEKDKAIERLTAQLTEQQQGGEKAQAQLSRLESKVEQLFGEQRTYIQQTTNALGQHVTRSAREQRDEQRLAHYLQHGRRPVATEVAPGYAVALLEQVQSESYDLMLVLGSSQTTELLAHAVFTELGDRQALTHASAAGDQGRGQRDVVAPAYEDLPQSIISLDHRKTACEALTRALGAQHLHQAVNVVHAPWIEYRHQERSLLVYACESTLSRLHQWLKPEARLLLVVGDALAQAGHSRFGVLPQLLQQLPTQQLDVVVEGVGHAHEQALAQEWQDLLNARERPAEPLDIPGAVSVRVDG